MYHDVLVYFEDGETDTAVPSAATRSGVPPQRNLIISTAALSVLSTYSRPWWEEVFKSQKLDGDAILILFVGKSKGRLVTNSGSVTICKFFSLENALKEAEISSGKPLGSITGVLDDGLSNYQSLLENWEVLARANATRPANGESTPQGKIDSEMTSPLENMQMAFSAGRPPTTATTTTNNSSLSSYHPNAVFVGGPICKQEENEDMCYGSGHVPDDTTDGFFDSTNTNNSNQNNGNTTNSVTKFDLSLMQQMTPSGQVDCGNHENSMQRDYWCTYLPIFNGYARPLRDSDLTNLIERARTKEKKETSTTIDNPYPPHPAHCSFPT
ncbi:unnamed protein product [Hymenolepis diminuta]|uniref:Med13_N domain-containing protein n=1 Tax=Hymenolepis diminuta TaxID=6216 RepID=A0A158QC96_HYMDI|nr:unnamed protein product [Hymenolepis diminuta]